MHLARHKHTKNRCTPSDASCCIASQPHTQGHSFLPLAAMQCRCNARPLLFATCSNASSSLSPTAASSTASSTACPVQGADAAKNKTCCARSGTQFAVCSHIDTLKKTATIEAQRLYPVLHSVRVSTCRPPGKAPHKPSLSSTPKAAGV